MMLGLDTFNTDAVRHWLTNGQAFCTGDPVYVMTDDPEDVTCPTCQAGFQQQAQVRLHEAQQLLIAHGQRFCIEFGWGSALEKAETLHF